MNMKTEKKDSHQDKPHLLTDCNISSLHSTNQLQLPSLSLISLNGAVNLKNLDQWEEDHQINKTNRNDKNHHIHRKATKLLETSSLTSLNFKSQLNTNLEQFKAIRSNHNFQDMCKVIKQENSSFLAKNIHMVKKHFDFGMFQKRGSVAIGNPKFLKKISLKSTKDKIKNSQEELYQIGNELAVRKKMAMTCLSKTQEYNNIIDNDDEINIQDRMLKKNNLAIEGKYNQVVSGDYYKEILKNKTMLEKAYRKEIGIISKDIEVIEEEINKMTVEQNNLYNQMEGKKRRYYDNMDAFHILEREREKEGNLWKSKDFLTQTREIEHMNKSKGQLEKMRLDYVQQKVTNEIRLEQIKETVDELKINMKSLEEYKNKLITQLIDYYFQILKEGIDVRSIGLSWVLVRIYELGANIENKDFPLFLEYSSINYLREQSRLGIQKKKMGIILKIFIDKYMFHFKQQEEEFTKKNNIKSKIPRRFSLMAEHVDFIEHIIKKYQNKNINGQLKQQQEDTELIQKGLATIRNSCVYAPDKSIIDSSITINDMTTIEDADSFEENKEDMMSRYGGTKTRKTYHTTRSKQSLTKSLKKKKVVDYCAYIRAEMKKIDYEMNELKDQHMKYFKKKYEHIKQKGISECVKYDLMFCALFGNYAVI